MLAQRLSLSTSSEISLDKFSRSAHIYARDISVFSVRMEWSGTTGFGFQSVENAPPLLKSEYEFETQFLISDDSPHRTTAGRFFLPTANYANHANHTNPASYIDRSGAPVRIRKSDGTVLREHQNSTVGHTGISGTLRPLFDMPPPSYIRTKKGSEPVRHSTASETARETAAAPYRIPASPEIIQRPAMEKRNATGPVWEVPERMGYAAMNALPTEFITRRRDFKDPRGTQTVPQAEPLHPKRQSYAPSDLSYTPNILPPHLAAPPPSYPH